MTDRRDDDFRIRPSAPKNRGKGFVSKVLKQVGKAGGKSAVRRPALVRRLVLCGGGPALDAQALIDWVAPRLEKKGLVLLSTWEYGFRNVTNSKRPINGPQDMKGLRLGQLLSDPAAVPQLAALLHDAVPEYTPGGNGADDPYPPELTPL